MSDLHHQAAAGLCWATANPRRRAELTRKMLNLVELSTVAGTILDQRKIPECGICSQPYRAGRATHRSAGRAYFTALDRRERQTE